MQDSGTLKKKFDDIFESTRYTKALDAISKSKKDMLLQSKEVKAEVMEFNAHLMSAKLFENDLQANEENQDDCKEELDRLKVEIDDNEARVSWQSYGHDYNGHDDRDDDDNINNGYAWLEWIVLSASFSSY